MTRERFSKYEQIYERAESLGITVGDRTDTLMDIESADLKFTLNIDALLDADDFDFSHDFCGIQNNIVRSDFPATDFNYFVPRYSSCDTESKQDILDALLPALQKTRNLYDLIALTYNADQEIVTATFASGGKKVANVAMDSGIAMIRDILKNIV